jgi:hypothetical protein
MSNLSRDEIKDLINNFDGYLLVTYYRQFDLERATVDGLVNDINSSTKRKVINHISTDVSNSPELCSEQRLIPPCTVLYKNGRREYVFGSFSDYNYIQELSNSLFIGEIHPTFFGTTEPVTAVPIRSTIR